MTEQVPSIVLDTNIVLDLLVFNDPLALPLRDALAAGQLRWLSTEAMRDELERVLAYPQIAKRLAFYALEPQDVLAARDAWVHTVAPAPKAQVTCKDPDDQRFIDLAVAHQCTVLSKDHAVLCMGKRLERWGAAARQCLHPSR
ncbi:MAG: putative toxin-antitoxin system toxin component, PIN family [Rhodoferax sp.]|nr:putative toxin-antitoxin system toxin component, PIN family [Rhodoferax sp.]